MKVQCTETAGGFWSAPARADFGRGKVVDQTVANRGNPRIVDQILGTLSLWRARARARAADRRMLSELSTLDYHTLRDIGVHRAYLQWQASKPFWRA
jgi:uncharacterized protein YjiS (DUF1127 family)